MTNEEKQLLLKDLSARLSCGIIVSVTDGTIKFNAYIESISHNYIQVSPVSDSNFTAYAFYKISEIKPYLRPLSSMTDEEREEWTDLFMVSITQELEQYTDELEAEKVAPSLFAKSHTLSIDWLNKKGFDYRGLISMGLALEAKDGMYNNKMEE